MFNVSQIRWLVTAVAATAAMLVVAAPAGAWLVLDESGGPVSTADRSAPAQVQKSEPLTNVVHEGRLAERRHGASAAVSTSSSEYIPGVTDSSTGVMQQVRENANAAPFTRPDSAAGTRSETPSVGNRDHIVADKAEPAAPTIPYLSHGEGVSSSYGDTYIPGVTDTGTGVFRELGVEQPTVPVTREVSDDSFSWNSDIVIGISAALLTALLMALGTFALVNQRRRRMAL